VKAVGLDLRALWIGAIVAVAVGLTVAYFASRPTVVRHAPGRVVQTAGLDFDPIRSDEIHTILAEDAIPAINPPVRYLRAGAASDIRDDEDVIGLVIGSDARAFPVATLSAHEIVNDVIGGQAVAVTW
jgi:hypothetical protein